MTPSCSFLKQAVTGLADQGRAIAARTEDPAQFAALKAETHWPDGSAQDRLASIRDDVRTGAILVLCGLGIIMLHLESQDVRGMQQAINVVFLAEALKIAARLESSLVGAT